MHRNAVKEAQRWGGEAGNMLEGWITEQQCPFLVPSTAERIIAFVFPFGDVGVDCWVAEGGVRVCVIDASSGCR